MNCEELHSYFEGYLRDAEVRSSSGAVAAHVAACAECSRFVAEQQELARNLQEICEAAGPVPEHVDAAVQSAFRAFVAKRDQARSTSGSRMRWSLVWGLSAAAAGVAVAAILMFVVRGTDTISTRPPVVLQKNGILVPEPANNPVVAAEKPVRQKPAPARRVRQSDPEERAAITPVRRLRSLPEGFRSVMYCDELSCPQDMEMIRVQVPSSVMPRRVTGLIQTSGSVTADVLVGTDGIARGIRFEEIEF